MDKNFFLGWFVPWSISVPLIVGTVRYRLLKPGDKVIYFYLVMSVIFTIGGYILRHTVKNNLPLLHVYSYVEFFILTEFYKKIIDEKKINRVLTILQLGFLLACLLNVIFWQGPLIYNSYSRSLGALLIMLLAVNYFARLFTKPVGEKATLMPEFWFNSGIFLYFSGAFVLFIFSNFALLVSPTANAILWNVHAAFVLIMYILFTIGFIKCRK